MSKLKETLSSKPAHNHKISLQRRIAGVSESVYAQSWWISLASNGPFFYRSFDCRCRAGGVTCWRFAFLLSQSLPTDDTVTDCQSTGIISFTLNRTHIQNLLPSPLRRLHLQIHTTATWITSNQTQLTTPNISPPVANPYRNSRSKICSRISSPSRTRTNNTNGCKQNSFPWTAGNNLDSKCWFKWPGMTSLSLTFPSTLQLNLQMPLISLNSGSFKRRLQQHELQALPNILQCAFRNWGIPRTPSVAILRQNRAPSAYKQTLYRQTVSPKLNNR